MSVFNLFRMQKCVVMCVFLMFCKLEAMSCCDISSTHTQLWKINNKWSDYIPNEGKDIRRKVETAAKERMIVSSHCKAGWRQPRVAELLKSWTSCMFAYPTHITQFHRIILSLWQRRLLFYFKDYLIPSDLNDGFYEKPIKLNAACKVEGHTWKRSVE